MHIPKHPATDAPETTKRQSSREQSDALALEIAEAFQDEGHLAVYKVYCRNFPQNVVHRAFAEVRGLPEHRVRRSRLALFIYLIKAYASEQE